MHLPFRGSSKHKSSEEGGNVGSSVAEVEHDELGYQAGLDQEGLV